MGSYVFSLMPNEECEIECAVEESGQRIEFNITEIDLQRMMRSIHLWKARQISE